MRLSNDDVARLFEEIADLLEIDDASPFRVRAYRTAASTLRGLGREARDMVAAGEPLTDLPGIGKDLAGKITEALSTGRIDALETLHRDVPPSLEALLRIPGLGPKRVRALYQQLGVENLDDLRAAAAAGRVRSLHGFGKKTEQRVLDQLAAQREKKHRIPRHEATPQARDLERRLRDIPGVEQVVIAGSFRRGRDTVGDLDVLVTAASTDLVMARFTGLPAVLEVTARGTTRASVLLRSGLQVDLRLVPPESFGAALHYFTGSKAHNVRVRRLGQQHGLKVNEYGVFRGGERVAGDTEESVFSAVGLPFITPELREDQGEIEAAQQNRLPRLIERGDLRGDLHAHTTASDGRASLRAMAEAARAAGLEYLAITDHAADQGGPRPMDARRLREQGEAIDRLNEELHGITLLKGVEVDIREDGSLVLPETVLARLDVVIASVHNATSLPRRQQTERLMRAMDHPSVTLLGHPGGRFRPEREGYAVDMERVLRHARECGCFVELDSQPRRLDLNETYCRLARERGVLVAIDSDSHDRRDFANLDGGVLHARRGWLEAVDVLNTRPLHELRRLLRRTH
ncbi:MAG: DNA polymerase/3'-5' exonuclease PolX [Gammaproteobacteria bacterium]|nr:DNA polymerase/3'-5' exonuclease PolX [Gammaproteobacteria bacterium]